MNHYIRILFVFTISLSLLIFDCMLATAHQDNEFFLVKVKAPNFSLKSISDGKMVSLSDFSGKVCLLFTFARIDKTIQSDKVVAGINKLQSVYQKDGFQVIGLDIYKFDKYENRYIETINKRAVKSLHDNGILFPFLRTDDQFDRIYRRNGWPNVILIGRQGYLYASYSGFDLLGIQLENSIRLLLGHEELSTYPGY